MKVSVVTINYNNSSELKKTIENVFSQSYTKFEHIIIDGGSTDESVKIIKENQEKFAYWVSERDNGIFHAMNKGILKSRGEYICMMNAGDLFYNHQTLDFTFNKKVQTADIIYGNALLESKGEIFGEKRFSKQITFDLFRKNSLSHQACFIRKDLHDQIGLYDESLKYSSDWKFLILAICKHNASTAFIDEYLAIHNCDGLTWNPIHLPLVKEEQAKLLQVEFKHFLQDYDLLDKYRNRTVSLGDILLNFRQKAKYQLKTILNK
ncbi:MAG: glycosyltransferase family 2 protein [Leeuwenhoekiella sp.]